MCGIGQRTLGASQWTLESAFGEAERRIGAGYGYRIGDGFELGLEASRREAASDAGPEHALELRLLVLASLVRRHGVDENSVDEIAPVLRFLRDLQRRVESAALAVHRARESSATLTSTALPRCRPQIPPTAVKPGPPIIVLTLSGWRAAAGRRCRDFAPLWRSTAGSNVHRAAPTFGTET